MKRTLQRPWGRKHRGSWIIQPDDLLKSLKAGDAVEIGKVQVGTRNLIDLVRLLKFPDQELLISANGKLEVQNIARYMQVKDGHPRTAFRLPRRGRHYFSLYNGAWLPEVIKTMVVLKPKKFA